MIGKLKQIPKFFKEIKEEVKKVNWSTRRELVNVSILVVIVASILTAYIACIDLGLSRVVQVLFK